MTSNIQSTNLPSSTSTPLTTPERASTLTSFMSSFYTTSDNPTAHDKYANDFFTPTATLIMGGKRADGFDEILAFRKSLWTSVSSRKHSVSKIFYGNKNDMMLYGTVEYVMRYDQELKVQLDWAARAEFDGDEESPKMRFYQVYLDTATQQAAAAAVVQKA